MRRIYLLPILFLALISAALAQPKAGLKPSEEMDTPAAVSSHTRVNLNVNVFVRTSKKDQAFKAQEQVRRMIYDLAGRECVVLRDVIAADCKLQSINVSTQRVPSSGEEKFEAGGLEINGNVTFRIVPKQ